ncbi:MAG: diphthine synthase [Nitrososphaeria archaeon]
MLALVGLGVKGVKSMTFEGFEVLKESDVVFVDGYTTCIPENFVEELKEIIKKDVIVIFERKRIEEADKILEEARNKNVSLAVLGDPLFATTHLALILECKKRNIPYKVVHNNSIACVLMNSFGLHSYKFGKIATIVRHSGTPATTIYFTLYENLIKKLHTIFLLEYDVESKEGVTPNDAFKTLKEAEDIYKLGAFSDETFVIVACRIYRKNEKLYMGKVQELLDIDFGPPPYSLIIPSDLHFVEKEALKLLFNLGEVEINNSKFIKKRVGYLIDKYVRNTKEALKYAREKITERKIENLFENIECYLDDTIRFYNLGEENLAMLSVGYAEGLLDALRFLGILEIKW